MPRASSQASARGATAAGGVFRSRAKDAFGILFSLLFALPAWSYPFGNDQALHWYIGRSWLDGVLPFVSAISSKPIGMFAVHALSTAIFGEGMWPIRVTETLTVLIVGWLIALCIRPSGTQRRDGEWGMSALLFSGIYFTFYDFWDTAHPELWESTFALAAFVVALRARTPWTRDAGAGALATTAFMFKFPAALPALGVSALCAVRALQDMPARESLRAQVVPGLMAVLRAAGRFLAGVVPVVLLVVLPFALGGELETMWEILGVYIFHYAEQAPPIRGLPAWFRLEHGGLLFLTTFALTVLALALDAKRRDREALWRLSWILLGAVLALGSVAIQGRYFPYHFVAIASFCAALWALSLRSLDVGLAPVAVMNDLSSPRWRVLFVAVALLAALFFLAPAGGFGQNYLTHVKTWIAYRTGQVEHDAVLRGVLPKPRNLDSPLFAAHLAEHINLLKRPGDTLCTRGFLTQLYPLTGLRCTSRHIVEENVGTGLPDWRREYRVALEQRPPTFMVTFSDRPRDVNYLKRRGYKLVYQEHIFRVFSLRAAP